MSITKCYFLIFFPDSVGINPTVAYISERTLYYY